MTPRERLKTVLAGRIPDCVPVSPDFSNMIPCRLTGKPFWDIYLYNDPPLWDAYLQCARYFDIDVLINAYYMPFCLPGERSRHSGLEPFIVSRDESRIVTQNCFRENGKRIWAPTVDIYPRDNPPKVGIAPEKIGLPPVPARYQPLEGVKPALSGAEGFTKARLQLGDQGLLGIGLATTAILGNEEDVYFYYDHPEFHERWAAELVENVERRFNFIMSVGMEIDFFAVGGSGSLVFQTLPIFRQLAFPAVKRAIELSHAAHIPTHVHSCGPEKALIKVFAEETSLTVIDPLEIPPMGDCDLADLKRRFGDKIVLKGNLHTVDVMLRGTTADVIRASKQAIDDAAAGGRFILSTGDQCGRDTPDENLRAMVETARTYGQYR